MRWTTTLVLTGALLLVLAAGTAAAQTVAIVDCNLGGPCVGTPGNDLITGSDERDEIRARAGDDEVRARGGDDLVYGARGADLIYGGRGADELRGGPGRDNLYGGPGRDTVLGGRGDDYVNTADGRRDFVDCGPGADSFTVDPVDVVRNCEYPAL